MVASEFTGLLSFLPPTVSSLFFQANVRNSISVAIYSRHQYHNSDTLVKVLLLVTSSFLLILVLSGSAQGLLGFSAG